MDELWYLALAYGVIWVGLIGYLAYVSRQALSLRQELDVFRDVLASEGEEEEPAWDDGATEETEEALSDAELASGERRARGDA